MLHDFEDTQFIKFFRQNNVEEATIRDFCKSEFRPVDLTKVDENWLASGYYYARQKGLRYYQAKSFASELTLFITGELVNTGVELIYKESLLDSHFCDVYNQFKSQYGDDSVEFWDKFIDYMINFYLSSDSWHYERKTKQFLLKLTENERVSLDKMDCKSLHDIIVFLLKNYDGKTVVDYKRDFPTVFTTKTMLSESEYEELMKVPVNTKTGKFCNIFYFYLGN